MKDRVRLVWVSVDYAYAILIITATHTPFVIITSVFVTVITIVGVVGDTMLAPILTPRLTEYCIVSNSIAVIAIVATPTSPRVVFPTTLAPRAVVYCVPIVLVTTDTLATLASADTIRAYPIAVVVGAKVIFFIRSVTYYALVRGDFIFFIRHVISPPQVLLLSNCTTL
jgi:hypothetical protein